MTYAICLIFLMFSHWIADFVVQGGNIVEGTADRKFIFSHCLRYTVSFPACAALTTLFLGSTLIGFFMFSMICVVTHALIDIVAIPIATSYFAQKNVRMGEMALACDQILHLSIIVCSFPLMFEGVVFPIA